MKNNKTFENRQQAIQAEVNPEELSCISSDQIRINVIDHKTGMNLTHQQPIKDEDLLLIGDEDGFFKALTLKQLNELTEDEFRNFSTRQKMGDCKY